jgi:hypothetical protein
MMTMCYLRVCEILSPGACTGMDEYKLTLSEDGDQLTGVSRSDNDDWKNVSEGMPIGRLQRCVGPTASVGALSQHQTERRLSVAPYLASGDHWPGAMVDSSVSLWEASHTPGFPDTVRAAAHSCNLLLRRS